MGQIVTTAAALSGGVTAVAGVAMAWRLELTGTWATDEYLTLLLTARATAVSEAIGHGAATGIAPKFLKTYKRKLYLVAGTAVYFSALDAPTVLNKLNQPGNSFIELANEYGFADDLLAIAIFRGKRLAFIGRQHIQIFAIDPDPALNDQQDTLENIGTVNGASVRGIGRGDVLFCADSGVRSLAQRQAAEDADVTDLGTPIDELIQAALDANGSAGICSIVEPRTARYWLAIGTTIYVFSYFQSSSVVAWSKYEASIPFAATTANYVDFVAGVYAANFTGLTVGRRYKFIRGGKELASTAPCVFTCGSTTLFGEDGEFVADATTAQVLVEGNSAPGATTFIFSEFFTPEKFVVFNGQIFVRDTVGVVHRYGGTDNATYDNSVCAWETPWLDARTPGTEKPARGIDAGMQGEWVMKLGLDPSSANPLKQVLKHTDSTFKLGSITTDGVGTHFKVRGESRGSGYAKFGMFVYHYNRGNQR